MAATAVEFDALPDSVRAAAQNHDLLLVADLPDRLVIFGVCRIVIWRCGREFARACINRAIGGMDAVFLPQGANLQFIHSQRICQLPVRIAKLLRFPQTFRRVFNGLFKGRKFRQFAEIEHVKASQFLYFFQWPAMLESGMKHIDTIRVRTGQFSGDRLVVQTVKMLLFLLQTEAPMACLQRADGLLESLVEIAANRHRFADGFHLRAKCRIGGGKLFKCEPRHLHDDVVQHRLEAGGRVFRDVVAQFIQ